MVDVSVLLLQRLQLLPRFPGNRRGRLRLRRLDLRGYFSSNFGEAFQKRPPRSELSRAEERTGRKSSVLGTAEQR